MMPCSRGDVRSAAPSQESSSARSEMEVDDPSAVTMKKESTALAVTMVLSGKVAIVAWSVQCLHVAKQALKH